MCPSGTLRVKSVTRYAALLLYRYDKQQGKCHKCHSKWLFTQNNVIVANQTCYLCMDGVTLVNQGYIFAGIWRIP